MIIGPVPPYAEVVRSHPQEMLVYQDGNNTDRENAVARYNNLYTHVVTTRYLL